MQTVSQLYQTIVAGNHWFECKLVIAGTITIPQSDIVQMSTSFDLFAGNGISVGNASSAEISVEMLVPSSTIPRRATLAPYVRACNSSSQSEWIPQGFFWLDTRERTHTYEGIDTLTLHGYDTMLKGELAMETKYTVDISEYPMPMSTAVAKICTRMGITQASGNNISSSLTIEYPGWGADALTSREVLQGIAAAHCGNWMMTADNKLRLVRLEECFADLGNLATENSEKIVTEGGDYIVV